MRGLLTLSREMGANALGSLSGFGVDFALLWLLLSFANLQYLLASSLAFLTGASVHFMIARRIAFKDASRPKREAYWVFLGVSVFDLALLTALMAVAVEVFMIPVLPARLMTAVFIGTVSFFLHKHITFVCRKKYPYAELS